MGSEEGGKSEEGGWAIGSEEGGNVGSWRRRFSASFSHRNSLANNRVKILTFHIITVRLPIDY